MSDDVRVARGGDGDPLLVLLHGLGATADVWSGLQDVLRARWPGRWIAPDLPGHGRSAPLPRYTIGHLAASVARVVPAGDRIAVLGHSLGGAVALALASGWFGVPVAAVCGVGIKVTWTADELARASALAARPNPVYPDRLAAAERSLKLAGLTGLVAANAVRDEALRETADGWTVAFDPAAFAVGAPDMAGLLAASRAHVVLAVGERDPMCTVGELRALVPDPLVLPGVGHNAHVQSPEALCPVLERLVKGAGESLR